MEIPMVDDTQTRLTQDDEGKTLVDETDEEIGEVIEIHEGADDTSGTGTQPGSTGPTLVVDTNPSITDTIKSALGWGDQMDDEDVYQFDDPQVREVTRDEITIAISDTSKGSGTTGETGHETATHTSDQDKGITEEGASGITEDQDRGHDDDSLIGDDDSGMRDDDDSLLGDDDDSGMRDDDDSLLGDDDDSGITDDDDSLIGDDDDTGMRDDDSRTHDDDDHLGDDDDDLLGDDDDDDDLLGDDDDHEGITDDELRDDDN